MKQLVADVPAWLASLLFIAAATVLWAGAALLVFLSGNGRLQGRS